MIFEVSIFENNYPLEVNTVVESYTFEVAEFGQRGLDGRSAYQIAVENGFVGTEIEWSNSFKAIKIINLPELP